jgi:predicted nucleotidyltransferase
MNLKELDSFKLHDAIYFHDNLNHAIFAGDTMRDDVREQLLLIAGDFIDHLGLDNIQVMDITLSGSNAAFTYTKHSDIDLHILVDMSKLNDELVYRELFHAKKTLYNDTHNILVNGYEVELYIQDANEPVISLGEYSILNDKWIKLPKKSRANLDQISAKLKFNKMRDLAKVALKHNDPNKIQNVIDKIKKYRKNGLHLHGEFGPENLAFKALRSKGIIKKLFARLNVLHSERLSLPEGASGYIPSYKERNDPRYKTALTVDIGPETMQQNASKLGSKISRAGIPPLLRL